MASSSRPSSCRHFAVEPVMWGCGQTVVTIAANRNGLRRFVRHSACHPAPAVLVGQHQLPDLNILDGFESGTG